MPAEGGEALLVTRKGGSRPLESTDGKVLFCLKPKEASYTDHIAELWKIPVDGGEESRVINEVINENFDVKRDGIYFASRPDQDGTPFLFYEFVSGKTKPITTLRNMVGPGFTVSPDEQRILYIQVGDWRSDLMLVENFR
jgi:hypothetical protein